MIDKNRQTDAQFAYLTLAWSAKISGRKRDHGLPIISFPFNSVLRRPSATFQPTFYRKLSTIFQIWAFSQFFRSSSLIYTSNFPNL